MDFMPDVVFCDCFDRKRQRNPCPAAFSGCLLYTSPVGISYTFRMGLVLDLRYHIGCTDLLKDGDYKLTNRVATLTVGWRF